MADWRPVQIQRGERGRVSGGESDDEGAAVDERGVAMMGRSRSGGEEKARARF